MSKQVTHLAAGGIGIKDLVILAALGLALYFAMKHYELGPFKPPPPPPPPPMNTPTSQRITCPACQGEGQLMLRLMTQSQSRGGSLSKGNSFARGGSTDKPYACPVCGGLGYRTLTLPVGAGLCDDCKGMGKRLFNPAVRKYTDSKDESTRLTAKPCMRCNSLGYIHAFPNR